MNPNIKCDINNLTDIRDKMLSKTEELMKKLDFTFKEIEESQQIYDSQTATYIREQCDNIISYGKKYVDNNVVTVIHYLDFTIQQYSEFLAETEKTINGGKSI